MTPGYEYVGKVYDRKCGCRFYVAKTCKKHSRWWAVVFFYKHRCKRTGCNKLKWLPVQDFALDIHRGTLTINIVESVKNLGEIQWNK